MKIQTTSPLMIVVLGLSVGATIASAQISVGVGAPPGPVGGIAGQAGFGGNAAGAAPGAAFGGSSAGSASAAGASSPLLTSGRAQIDAFESIGMRQARLAQTSTATAANADPTSAVVPIAAHDAASVALSAGFSGQTIRDAKPDEREFLFTQIHQRIETSSDAIDTLKRDSKSLNAEAKSDFKAATKEVAAREKELKASVKEARKASAETWTEKRADVAARYDAYAQAVARAEHVAAASSAQTAVTGAAPAPKSEADASP